MLRVGHDKTSVKIKIAKHTLLDCRDFLQSIFFLINHIICYIIKFSIFISQIEIGRDFVFFALNGNHSFYCFFQLFWI